MGCSSSKEVEQDPWLLCLSGQVKQLERWLARGGNPCALDRQGGRGTLLHAAARGDQAECIKVLVKAGADVNAVTKLRGSPLHAAAQHGTGHAVAALLESGADPYVKNAEGKTPIDVAAANGFHQTAALMRSAGRPRPSSAQLDSLLPPPPPSTHYFSASSGGSGQRLSGSQPAGPPSGTRASPRASPGPGTPVGRVSPSPGVGPSTLGTPQPRPPGYPPAYPAVWQGGAAGVACAAGAAGGPPLNAWASTPILPVNPQPEPPMAVSASGPAAVATPPPQQVRDRSPAGRLSPGGTPVVAARGTAFPGSVSLPPPPATQPPELLSEPSPSAPPGTMSMIGDALGAPGWWMHQQGAPNGAVPPAGQQHSRAPSPAPQRPLAEAMQQQQQQQQQRQQQQQLASPAPGQEGAAPVPSHPLSKPQLVALDGVGGLPPLPPHGAESHSASSSDGVRTKDSSLSDDPLLSWIGSQLATRGGSTLLTGVPPAAQQAQQAAQQAQQIDHPHPAQQAPQQHVEQRAEQGSAGSGRSGGGTSHTGSGGSNGAVAGPRHVGSGGSGGGKPMSPTGGSGGPSRTSTLASASSLMVDIRPWEISYKELTLQQSIGAGSFGKVYKAKWHETLVAVKVLLDLENVSDTSLTLSNPVLVNLHKECSLMASLRHPNIVQFMGVCSCPPAMITEFCGKGSLTDVLKAGKASPAKAAQLTWTRRLQMALDAAKGMLYLHKRGIVHRDLKSPNLLVDQMWRVKVADFNLSKLVEGTDSCNSKTGTMAGANPKWLAPEVIGGYSATEKGDTWSYGVVLWELLTWEIPWNKVSPWTVVATLMNGGCLAIPPLDDPAQPLPGTAADNAAFAPHLPAYVALIRRCWAQNAYDRPDFEEVIHDLRNICEALLRSPAADTQQ